MKLCFWHLFGVFGIFPRATYFVGTYYRPKFGKVVFSQVCVILFGWYAWYQVPSLWGMPGPWSLLEGGYAWYQVPSRGYAWSLAPSEGVGMPGTRSLPGWVYQGEGLATLAGEYTRGDI